MVKFWDIKWTSSKNVYFIQKYKRMRTDDRSLSMSSIYDSKTNQIDGILDENITLAMEKLNRVPDFSITDDDTLLLFEALVSNLILISTIESEQPLNLGTNISGIEKWLTIGINVGKGIQGSANNAHIKYGNLKSPIFIIKSEVVRNKSGGDGKSNIVPMVDNNLMDEYINYHILTKVRNHVPNFSNSIAIINVASNKWFFIDNSINGDHDAKHDMYNYRINPEGLSNCINDDTCLDRQYILTYKFNGTRVGDMIRHKPEVIKKYTFNILLQICKSLEYAYEQLGYLHRDMHRNNVGLDISEEPFHILYPDGLLIKTHMKVKIFDFGMSMFDESVIKILDNYDPIDNAIIGRIGVREMKKKTNWVDWVDVINLHIVKSDINVNGQPPLNNDLLLSDLYIIVESSDVINRMFLNPNNRRLNYEHSKIDFSIQLTARESMKQYIKMEVCFGKGFVKYMYDRLNPRFYHPTYFKAISENKFTDFQGYKYDIYRLCRFFLQYQRIDDFSDYLFDPSVGFRDLIYYCKIEDRHQDTGTYDIYNRVDMSMHWFIESIDIAEISNKFNNTLHIFETSPVTIIDFSIVADVNAYYNTLRLSETKKKKLFMMDENKLKLKSMVGNINTYANMAVTTCLRDDSGDHDIKRNTKQLIYGNPGKARYFTPASEQIFFSDLAPTSLPHPPQIDNSHNMFTYVIIIDKYTNELSIKYGRVFDHTMVGARHGIIAEGGTIVIAGELAIMWETAYNKYRYYINTNSVYMLHTNTDFIDSVVLSVTMRDHIAYYYLCILLTAYGIFKRMLKIEGDDFDIQSPLQLQPGLNITRSVNNNLPSMFQIFHTNGAICPTDSFITQYNKFGQDNKIKNACMGYINHESKRVLATDMNDNENEPITQRVIDNVNNHIDYRCAWDIPIPPASLLQGGNSYSTKYSTKYSTNKSRYLMIEYE